MKNCVAWDSNRGSRFFDGLYSSSSICWDVIISPPNQLHIAALTKLNFFLWRPRLSSRFCGLPSWWILLLRILLRQCIRCRRNHGRSTLTIRTFTAPPDERRRYVVAISRHATGPATTTFNILRKTVRYIWTKTASQGALQLFPWAFPTTSS